MAGVRLRRAPHLVSYWTDDGLVTCNYAARTAVLNDAVVTHALAMCTDWTPAAELRRRLRPVVHGSAARLIDSMVEQALLVRSDRPENPRSAAARTWSGWSPAAAFFHLTTKDVRGPRDRLARERQLRERYEREGKPPQTKRYPRAPVTPLPPPRTHGEFADVLLGRRTWRKFAADAVPVADIATLLQLTSGVQRVEHTLGLGTVHLKTSPSSGARQPLETYLVAVNVDGLAPGVYHYVPDAHALERVKKGATSGTIARYVPDQPWYEPASALIVLTAVFARTQWRYPFPRAYRSVLLEAGHVCQTFCLAATWLGLAPFCTGRFADTAVEQDLKIDGITESFVYGAGVGRRPAGLDWAPWPDQQGPDADT